MRGYTVSMAVPNQIPKVQFEGIDTVHQQWLNQLADTVNSLLGHNGEIELGNHVSLSGYRIKNLGAPVETTDALQNGTAASSYSASALQPKLQSGGTHPLTTYRILNSGSQRESTSSWLNDLMSAPPSANNLFPTITNGTGTVTVSMPSGRFTFADGSFLNTLPRTDILSVPSQYAISSISCTGNVVSVVCAASGLVAGNVATIAGVTPSPFNGTYPLTSSSGGGANLTYQEDLGTASGSGGYVQVNGIWYYALRKRSTALTLLGPYLGDTAQSRLQACLDGYCIVAVVTITNTGGQISLSGGGGSPIVGSPAAGAFF